MDALLLPFLAALLAEIGDKTQLFAVLLAARYRAPGTVIAAIAAASCVTMLIGAAGGRMIHDLIPFRAIGLMVALALIFAGAGAFLPQKPHPFSSYGRIGTFGTCFVGFLILEFGDKTQFLAMTLAARADSLWIAGLAAAAGVTLANVPAVLFAAAWPKMVPLRGIRVAIGALLIVAGAIAALGALRLI
jgi:putative Ca2+/H+ antiporter (TMEM165/GDT1 family)